MPAKTEKAKGLHHLQAYYQEVATTNGPVANVIYGNVQFYVFDEFQGVADMVLNRLPNSSRVGFRYFFFGSFVFFCLVFVMPLCASVFCALWSPAGKGLSCWISFVVYNCEFVSLGQMWYLIVSIPDLCTLTYFVTNIN